MRSDFAIIFDMDGVMVDNNTYHKKAWKAFVEKYGLHLSDAELKAQVYGKTNQNILRYIFGSNISNADIQKFAEEKEALYRACYTDEIKPVRGLVDFLDLSVAHNIPLAVATSAPPENVDFVLSSIGVKMFFKIIIDDTIVKVGKPDPEIYLVTAKKLGKNPADCIVFEDSLSGIQSALQAGMQVIAITTTHTRSELSHADYVINDFTQTDIEKLRRHFDQ